MPLRIGLAYNQRPATPEPAHPPSGAASPDLDDRYAEWDTPETIDAVAAALGALGEVIRLEATDDFPARLAAARPDFVFNIAEGLHGPNREAHVPAICEFLGIPVHASDPLTLALCHHKGRAKEILRAHGVPTAPFVILHTPRDVHDVDFAFPVFAKPVHEGSGKGVSMRSRCATHDELATLAAELLARYRQPVLVEPWLPGEEFTVGVLGNGREARCLPLVRLRLDALPAGALPIYGYEAKWTWDTPEAPLPIHECPAQVDDALADRVRTAALGAYHALGCRDWARIDIRCDAAGDPQVVELNPLPGILPDPEANSCLPTAARAAGMTYDELIREVAMLAWRRIREAA